jgi:DNA-binding response OmpR family regulator
MKKSILVLDDKPSIGKVIALYLSAEYDFHYFENPISGIKWLQEGNMPDLIITDIYMPQMKGTDFLSFMKRNELFRHIPIIFLSGEEDSGVRIKLLEQGAEDFILKPFNPLELKVRIKKALK